MYRKIFCILLLIQVLWICDGQATTFHVHSSEGRCLLEIPRAVLGRAFLVVSRLDSVYENRSYQRGSRLGKEMIVSFEQKHPGKVDVFMPDYRVGEKKTSVEMRKLLARSEVEMSVMSCPVLREDQERIVIDITGMMERGEPFFDGKGKRVLRFNGESDRFSCTVMREMPIVRRQWKREGDVLTEMPVTTTFFLLREQPWQEREKDRRVGFSSVSYDYFRDGSTGARVCHVIRRWALEPRDKEAYRDGRLSEPCEPIVFYLDPMIPDGWKSYFVEAVEDWQRAFEAAGFRNAIVARDIPEGMKQPLSSLRGLILWQDSLRGEVVDVNTDPRSGEIIQARMHWSPVVLDSLKYDWITRSALWSTGFDLEQVDEQVTGHLIRVTLGRQIGQALGLLPNKLATAWIPADKLRDNAWLGEHGMSASIMGDVVLNTMAQPEDRVMIGNLFPVVGSYDRWAIRWGYSYWEEEQASVKALEALLRENIVKPEHGWYATSVSPTAIEAVANLGVLGNDPVQGAGCALENVKRVFGRANLIRHDRDTTDWGAWVRCAGGKNGVLYDVVLPVLQQFGGIKVQSEASCGYVVMPAAVEREIQQEAMAFLSREVFVSPQWLLQSPLIKKAGLNSTEVMTSWQGAVLEFLFEKGMPRFALNQVMLGENSYTLNDFLDNLYRAIWFEPGKEKTEMGRDALRMKYLEVVEKRLNGYIRGCESIALQVHLNKLYETVGQVLSEGNVPVERRKSLVRCKIKIEDVIKKLL